MISLNHIILLQGGYYLISGLWPILHLKSFETITGRKTDRWLVYTVALMIVSSAVLFLYDGLDGPEIYQGTFIVAVLNCIFLSWIDIYFSLKKKMISKIYLLDGFLEIFILIELTI